MHIALIVTDLSPPRIGGISKVATEITIQYLKKGHSVDVFCLKRTCDVFEKHDHLRLIPVTSIYQIYKDYPVVSFSIHAFTKLLKEHKKRKYDISHAMNFNNFGMPFVKSKLKKAGIAHISTAFETTEMEISAKWSEFKSKPTLHCLAQIVMELFLAPWQKAYIGWADLITTEDCETQRNLILKGLPIEKIRLIPSGIDIKAIDQIILKTEKKSEVNLNIVCPGRVDSRKGSQFLIKAFASFSKKHPLATLEFVGGGRGDYLEQMKNLAKDLGVEEKVNFTGRVDNILEFYNKADIIVIPSLSEGIPITLQEALAFRKPILCSKLPGTYAYASHLPSIQWFEPANVTELEGQLEKMINKDFDEAISKGREFIEKYDWSQVANQYLKTYEEALKN